MRRRSVRSVALEIVFNVSKTPSPFDATASTHSYLRSLSSVSSNASTEAMEGRSRLFSWRTSGISSMRGRSRPGFLQVLEALDVRVEHRQLRIGDEDDPVDPFSTSLRVVL
jgi:hypothetical protein